MSDKESLRTLITELTDRMVKALDPPVGVDDTPEAKASAGKETATFGDIRGALQTVCSVYQLLHGTGDFDNHGSALTDMERKFHGSGNQGGRGTRNPNGRGHGAVSTSRPSASRVPVATA